MANFQFNVNTDATIILTAKLERLNKIAFPSAVRSSLSDAAFYMKQSGISNSANKNMTVRNRTVFKKFTGVEKARFNRNIEQMKASVGFIPKDGVKGSKVPQGMEANEFGGRDSDGWMYLKKTRVSGSEKRLVRNKSRFKKSNILNTRRAKNIATKKSLNFVQLAFESFEQKKAFYFNTKKGKILAQVTSYVEDSNGSPSIKLDFLMRRRKDFNAKAKATHFVKEAALTTQKKMEDFYAKNAQFQFDKVLKSTI